jgi:hypothetical protein
MEKPVWLWKLKRKWVDVLASFQHHGTGAAGQGDASVGMDRL